MVGSVEDTGFILRGFGNACRWAELDGDGDQDMRLNLGSNGYLGTTIMAMEVANLDGDTGARGPEGDDEELIVGTFFDLDPDHAEHFRLGGSLYVFDKSSGGDDLVELASVPLDYGVCGVHRIPYSGAGPLVHYVVAGTARGQIYVLRYDHAASELQVVYRSRFFAPMAEAYNSIRSFPLPGGPEEFRIVFGSSGGIFAIDVVLPESCNPSPDTPPSSL